MKKSLKIKVVALLAFMLVIVSMSHNDLNAAFRFRSSGSSFGLSSRRSTPSFFGSSSSSSRSSGFSLFKNSNSSSSSRVGTFRSRINARNNVLRSTQQRVNSRTYNTLNSNTLNHSWGGRNSFWHGFTGGLVGGMISRMMFGNHGYYGGGYSNGGYYGSGYYQGPGMVMSSVINFIVMIIVVVIIWKIIKSIFGRGRNYNTFGNNSFGGTPYNNYDSQRVVQENEEDFRNQDIQLTKMEAKNYINDLPLSPQDKLNHINRIESFSYEEQIVEYVEDVERSISESVNISLSDGIGQGIEYVSQHMHWLDQTQKDSLITKIKQANSLEEIEEIISPFDK